MIASVFENNSVILGVDYRENPLCVKIFEANSEEEEKIRLQYDYVD
jgi:hypothetical protein